MTCPESIEQPLKEDVCSVPSRFWTWVILLLILLLAASLRLYKLGQISPPGLNQDEAVNAWNAWCLLKTGKDQVGVSWPIFYLRTLGSNNTPLYIYLMIPFFAVCGFSIWSARLVSAVFGILCIPVIYYTGYRLFDRRVGLMAALLLALNPWHLHLSRWAIESGICPLLGIVPLAALLWAGIPVSDDEKYVPRPLIAVFAGAATGISCYGYWAARIFIPAFLGLAVLISIPALWASAKTRKGLLTIAAFGAGFFAFFGPLAWQHIFHPEGIARRTHFQKLWGESAPVLIRTLAVIIRYINHFSPDFLFIRGDRFEIQAPAVGGEFHWYSCLLMITGIAVLLWKCRSSRSARILLAFLAAYPLSDSFGRAISSHCLRSSPGLCSLILPAAVGAVVAGSWLWKRNKKLFSTALVIFIIAVIGLNVRYVYHYFGEYNRRQEIYHQYHTDLVEACRWLKPRFDEYDAIFCTTERMNMPYVITLVALGYDPKRWLNEPCEFINNPGSEFDYYNRYGKMYFTYTASVLSALSNLPANARVLFIVRPGELGLKNPTHQIYSPNGTAALWLCEAQVRKRP
jgi:4-amino-4-deoxy-L-arabinose transferase-like glycosyltransferase